MHALSGAKEEWPEFSEYAGFQAKKPASLSVQDEIKLAKLNAERTMKKMESGYTKGLSRPPSSKDS